jgi:two-component system, chemotaxis family, response regulator Rcp1
MNSKTVGRPMEILLVEDNLEDARMTIQSLKHEGVRCRVTLMCDGEEAMAFLHRKGVYARAPRPDMILLDLELPKLNGPQILAEVRANPSLESIPVVVLTGSLIQQTLLEAEQLRVDGFMTKPVSLEQFIGVIKSLRRCWLSELILPSLE